jgi:hypothetical protein
MTQQTAVVLGVDTHKDVHVGVVVDLVGRILGTRSVTTTQVGHDELEQWATSFGPLLRAGIEGACAYGAGLARFLTDRGHQIVEVARPERRVRRREGKHDTIDDREAARAALAGEGTIPKSGQGQVEMIRALRVVRRSAAQARGVVANQLHSLLVTAPQPATSCAPCRWPGWWPPQPPSTTSSHPTASRTGVAAGAARAGSATRRSATRSAASTATLTASPSRRPRGCGPCTAWAGGRHLAGHGQRQRRPAAQRRRAGPRLRRRPGCRPPAARPSPTDSTAAATARRGGRLLMPRRDARRRLGAPLRRRVVRRGWERTRVR